MPERNTTIDVGIDIKASPESIEKLNKAISDGIGNGTVQKTRKILQDTAKQIQDDTASKIYRNGVNSTKVKSNLRTLSEFSRRDVSLKSLEERSSAIDSKKTIREALEVSKKSIISDKEKTTVDINSAKVRREELKNRIALTRLNKLNAPKEEGASKQNFFSRIFTPVTDIKRLLGSINDEGKGSAINLQKLASSFSATSLLRALGPVGVGAAVATGVLAGGIKLLSYSAKTALGYNANAFGSGYDAASFAALQNGKVVNQDFGENVASSIDQNRLLFSQANRFRLPQIASQVLPLLAQYGSSKYGGSKEFSWARHITSDMTASQIENKLLASIKKSKNPTLSLGLGSLFGLSDSTVAALQNPANKNKNIGQLISGQADKYKEFNTLSPEAYAQTGAIDSLKGTINLYLIPQIVNLSNNIKNLGAQYAKNGAYSGITNQLGVGGGSFGLSGNTPKGSR